MAALTRLPSLLLLLSTISITNAIHLCPLLGPIYPRPTDLSHDASFNAAMQNITNTLQDSINAGKFSGDSLSIQIFDASDAGSLFSLSYTAEDVNKTLGVSQVDENTVFRIGSTSKLFTMFMILIDNGFASMQDPIANYIPELRQAVNELSHNATMSQNGIDFTKWNEVTVGQLASHLAGIARDYGVLDLTEQAPMLGQLGFPTLPKAQVPSCGVPNPCSRKQFFTGLLQSHPIVPTSSTPIYSNAAYQLLGYAVEAMAGTDYQDFLSRKVLSPLGMTRTFYNTPNMSLGVIPNSGGQQWWNFAMGDETPVGGIYSSAKDMAAFGRAILNSTLISAPLTRQWMKPMTHTSSLGYGVGATWEILSFGNERPIDLYTKSGDIGAYSSVIALSPDHNVGFVVMGAGQNTHVSLAFVSDMISATLIPALEQSAKNQANQHFAGTYALSNGNSSISIITDDGPALSVTSWINNSTNMLDSYATLNGISDPSMLSIRLYPTGLEHQGQASFRAVIPPPLPSGIGPFSSSCISWVTVDSQVYGNVGIDEFVFNVDGNGDAVSVSPRALRTVLQRTH